MLLDGFNHVAVMTGDTDRFVAFFTEVFGAEVLARPVDNEEMRLTLLKIGPRSEINLFEHAGQHRARAPDADVRPRTARPHGSAGRHAGGLRHDP